MELKKLLPNLKENVLLKNYTTFKIGGPARYFYIAKTKNDLVKAVKLAKENNLPFFVLGGGSKILVSDKGFVGMVIKLENKKYKVKDMLKFKTIYAEAGIKLSSLIKLCLNNSLTGLEWASGIPNATIGGAIRGNAGAFGQSISDIVERVEFFNSLISKIKHFDVSECKFNYRNSIFKQDSNLIILSAELKLEKANQDKIKQRIREILNYRQQHHPMNFASAGSIFINPKNQSAGVLVESCGLKGKQIGGAQISQKHANFIVNLKKAKANDVKGLINLAKTEVRKKFHINLKEEIQYLGFF